MITANETAIDHFIREGYVLYPEVLDKDLIQEASGHCFVV